MASNSTLDTIDDYIDDGRILLQDTVQPYRYDDSSLVIAMNVTVLEGRRLRPDLFVYQRLPNGQQVPHFQAKDGSKLIMEQQFRLAFLHGMVAHALERDQEDVQDERSQAFMNIFNSILMGRSTIVAAAKGTN